MIIPGATGIPRLGPNGGIIVRSALEGPLVEVGRPGAGAPQALRSQFQFEEPQELNAEIVALIDGCDLTFVNVPVGAYVFIQCVLSITSQGQPEVFMDPDFRYYPGGVQTIFWEPTSSLWGSLGEGQLVGQMVPFQCQTPPLVAPSATLQVQLWANGNATILNGHFQAELILP